MRIDPRSKALSACIGGLLLLIGTLPAANAQIGLGDWAMTSDLMTVGDSGISGQQISARSRQLFEDGDCRQSNIVWSNGAPLRFRNGAKGDPTSCQITIFIHCVGGKYDFSFVGPPTAASRDLPFTIRIDDAPPVQLVGRPDDDDNGRGQSSFIKTQLTTTQLQAIAKARSTIALIVQGKTIQFSDLKGTEMAFRVLDAACPSGAQ